MSDRPGLTIRRQVAVLARVTASLKAELREDVRRRLERLELELRQLDVQEKRLLGAEEQDRERAVHVAAEIQRQRDGRRREIKELLARERQVDELEDGKLVRRGSVEAEAHVSVGDRWDEIAACEVVLEDGVVVEIRRGAGE